MGEAVWSAVRIVGRSVSVQAFSDRVLKFTPSEIHVESESLGSNRELPLDKTRGVPD